MSKQARAHQALMAALLVFTAIYLVSYSNSRTGSK
jgi:hypothetical protein